MQCHCGPKTCLTVHLVAGVPGKVAALGTGEAIESRWPSNNRHSPESAGKRTRLGPTWEPFHAYSSALPRWKASKKDAKLLICCLTRNPSGLSSAACYSHSAVNQASVRCFVHCGRFLASLFALTKTFSQPFITWLAIFQVGVTDVIPSSRSR